MAAINTDKFKKLAKRWVGSIGAGGVADAAVTTIPLASVTNLPTDTAIIAVIDRVDTNGTSTATLEESVIGVVSGTNLVTCIRGAEGTAQAHSAGAVVEILFTAKGINDLIDGLLAEHSQLGAHTADVISEKTSGSGVTIDGVKLKDSIPYADTIAEKTADTGVTIDGLLIKDGVGVYTDKAPNINVKARVYLSASQTNLTNDAWTKVLFDTENYDIGGDYDVDNHRFVAPVTGYYLITVKINYEAPGSTADTKYYAGIYVNGALYSAGLGHKAAVLDFGVSITDVVPVAAGQYIEGYARNASGVNTVDIYPDGRYTFMTIHLLSV